MIEADIDGLTDAQDAELKTRLEFSGIACVLAPTHKSRPGARRRRLVAFPSRNITPSEWPTVRSQFIAAFGIAADENAGDAARISYRQVVALGQPVEPTLFQEGALFDVDTALKNAPPIAKIQTTVRSGAEWLVLIDSIGDGSRNDTLAALAGALYRSNLAPELAHSLLHAVNQARCKPPLSEREVNLLASSIARRELARRGLR